MKKVILMHGKDTDPAGKWYPWFGSEVEKLGYESITPELPNSTDPDIEEWMNELDKAGVDEDTILVGHSRGGMTVLRWLEKQPKEIKVFRVVLVGANSGLLADRHIPTETNHGFYTENGYDFEKIKQHCDDFVVMHSTDDHIVPYDNGVINAKGLGARLLTFNDKRHWGTGHDGIAQKEILEILEACIGFDKRKALLIAVNNKKEFLIQDRRNYKKPDWGFFGGGIENKEEPINAVIREAKEELDLDINEKDIKYISTQCSVDDKVKAIRYLFLYKTNQEEFTVLEGQGALWMSVDEARKHLDDQEHIEELIRKINSQM